MTCKLVGTLKCVTYYRLEMKLVSISVYGIIDLEMEILYWDVVNNVQLKTEIVMTTAIA